jgi:hypothetical protein
MELTADRLRELVHYDPQTGEFTWVKKRRRCSVGKRAGCTMKNGYRTIRVDDTLYLAHRLAWLYVTGDWPTDQIDHINGVRNDNRFENLRKATNLQNAHNRKYTRNKSGFQGVRKENSKWLAEIKVDYKPVRLGLFNTPEEAHAAYCEAKKRHHSFGHTQ